MWLNSDDLEHDLELANAGGNSKLNTRKFYKWLEKINKKYNYDIWLNTNHRRLFSMLSNIQPKKDIKKPRKKKDNSKKTDYFSNCRCCGQYIRGDYRSNFDKRYCQDCL